MYNDIRPGDLTPENIFAFGERLALDCVGKGTLWPTCGVPYAQMLSLFQLCGISIGHCEGEAVPEESWKKEFKVRLKVKIVWLAGKHTPVREYLFGPLSAWLASDHVTMQDFKEMVISLKANYYFFGGNILPNSIGRARTA